MGSSDSDHLPAPGFQRLTVSCIATVLHHRTILHKEQFAFADPSGSTAFRRFRAEVKALLEKGAEPAVDNDPADWSKDAVDWCVQNGLLHGNEHGDLMLRSPISREQFCVMLKRYHDTFHK